MPILFGGHILPPLVEIGLTDLSKFGGAMAPPAPPGTTGLIRKGQFISKCPIGVNLRRPQKYDEISKLFLRLVLSNFK